MDRRDRREDQSGWVRNAAMASQIGIFLAVATIIGWWIGQALDKRFGTTPYLMALFTLLGVAAGFIEMFRVVTRISADEDARARRDRDKS